MQTFIIQSLFWFKRRRFVGIVNRTFRSLFPFILLASIIRVINFSLFTEYSYVSQIFSISSWLSVPLAGRIMGNFVGLIEGITGLLTTYFAAKYTAEFYVKDSEMAGITGLIFSLILDSREIFSGILNDGDLTHVNLPTTINLVLAVFIGYFIGLIFKWTSVKDITAQDYPSKRIRPVTISLFLAVFINALLYLASIANINSTISSFLTNLTTAGGHTLSSLSSAFFLSLFTWTGMTSSFSMLSPVDDTYFSSNLSYALQNHTTSGIPYPYTTTTLYQGFGAFGGVGSILALLFAILWVSKNQRDIRISLFSLFPTLFNSSGAFLLGVPVMFNVVYFLPFVTLPLVNMVIARIILAFHLMAALVYPVPSGTPSPLIAFVGTGGSLRALALGCLIFALNVLIYIPFVKLDNRLREKMERSEESEVGHEKS